MNLYFETIFETIIGMGSGSFNILVFSESEPFNRFRVGTRFGSGTMQSKSGSDPNPPWFRSELDPFASLP